MHVGIINIKKNQKIAIKMFQQVITFIQIVSLFIYIICLSIKKSKQPMIISMNMITIEFRELSD